MGGREPMASPEYRISSPHGSYWYSAKRWAGFSRRQDLEPQVHAGIRLALSNALTTNNRLCSYATDYGRPSALFSVRGYSLRWLPEELNPLHMSGGRGTLLQCIQRVTRSCDPKVRRYVWNHDEMVTQPQLLELSTRPSYVQLHCASASDVELKEPVDLVVFDPPYFDFIAYDELAELFRA